ncbi:hypothetical protein [Butyrivibrio fibrisolvens]|uniref:hypothetical protein n=1 Tax=Butyrivibrio fibrisolvens TaxID=831 RepID=UPI0003B5C342|nr:hypothetical protein [Butyrivibrio fibrisolvens]
MKEGRQKIAFYVICIIISILALCLYSNEVFIKYSDFNAHIKYAESLPNMFRLGLGAFLHGENERQLSYPVWHIIFYAVDSILNWISSTIVSLGNEWHIKVLAVAIENMFLLLFTYILYFKYMYKKLENYKFKAFSLSFLAGLLIFIGPIYLPILNHYYLGQFTANVWHNPTTIVVKPLAFIVFQLFCEIFEKKEIQSLKRYLLFGGLLAFSIFLKPSFIQCFLPAVVIICLVDFFFVTRTNLLKYICIAISVIPAGILTIIMGRNSTSGFVIKINPFFVWSQYSNNCVMSLLVSIAFPLTMFWLLYHLYSIKKKINCRIVLAWICFVVALLQFILFDQVENGQSQLFGDFLWAVYISVGFINIESLVVLVDSFKDGSTIRNIIPMSFFSIQAYCGIAYFMGIIVNSAWGL